MHENKGGRFLRGDEMVDKELIGVGVNFTDRTMEIPQDVRYAQAENDIEKSAGRLWDTVKLPALFLTLVVGIGVCKYMGLMAEVIAAPGMCVCAACFGWNAKKH